MQMEYVDVVFANRPDSNTPMEGKSASIEAAFTTFVWLLVSHNRI